MEIYGELFFLENILADGVIAALTLKIWKRKIFTLNYIIAVLLMTLYSFFIFIPYSTVTYSAPVKIIVTFIVVKILFFDSEIKLLVQAVVTFLGVGMIMAGAVTFSLYLMKSEGISSLGIIYVRHKSYPVVMICIAASYVFIFNFFRFLSEKRKENLSIAVIVIIGDYECKFKAIIDTGNFLRDPVENLPVMIVEAESIKPLLKKIIGIVKLRVIPYKSIGTDSGTIMGIKADKIIIEDGNEEYEGRPAIVAVYSGYFGLKNGCNAILHPEMLKKEIV